MKTSTEPRGSRFVGRYRLEEVLGQGATGVVYRAVDGEGTEVALKLIRSELAQDDVYRQRLAQEVRAALEIRHRHIVPLLEAGESDGVAYIAFQFFPESRTLAEELGLGALPPRRVARLARQLGSAIDALHEHGIVHRDIKPSNVIVSGDDFLLTDFGLAKGRAYTLLTRPGRVVGTVDYLAPELIRGERATAATDIYAFGCAVYECATGQPPFAGRSIMAIGVAHLEELPADPAALRPDLPPTFCIAVLQALAKDADSRPTTAIAYARMLQVGLGEAG